MFNKWSKLKSYLTNNQMMPGGGGGTTGMDRDWETLNLCQLYH